MKIVQYYSHLNGFEFLQYHKPHVWKDLQAVIEGVVGCALSSTSSVGPDDHDASGACHHRSHPRCRNGTSAAAFRGEGGEGAD